MKLEPYKFYIEDDEDCPYIFYMQTDDKNVYDAMYINRKSKKCFKDKGKTIVKSIEDYNRLYPFRTVVEISEGAFILETL